MSSLQEVYKKTGLLRNRIEKSRCDWQEEIVAPKEGSLTDDAGRSVWQSGRQAEGKER